MELFVILVFFSISLVNYPTRNNLRKIYFGLQFKGTDSVFIMKAQPTGVEGSWSPGISGQRAQNEYEGPGSKTSGLALRNSLL